MPNQFPVGTSLGLIQSGAWGCSLAQPSAFHLHPYAGSLLSLGDDLVPDVPVSPHLHIGARPLASRFRKSDPAFHQALTSLGLAFTPHRTLSTGCSFLQPEQCLALATDPGPSRPAKPGLSGITLYIKFGFPHPQPGWKAGSGKAKHIH